MICESYRALVERMLGCVRSPNDAAETYRGIGRATRGALAGHISSCPDCRAWCDRKYEELLSRGEAAFGPEVAATKAARARLTGLLIAFEVGAADKAAERLEQLQIQPASFSVPSKGGLPMAVRAKVRCESIEGQEIKFSTVYEEPDGRDTENQRFTEATPWGEIRLGINNPAALEQFEAGKEYFVDFTPASPA